MARPKFEKIQKITTPDALKGRAVVQNPIGLTASSPKPVQSGPSAWDKAWSGGNAINTASGLIQGITGVATASAQNAQNNEGLIESYDNQIDSYENTQFNYGDFDSLQSAYSPVNITPVDADDLRTSDGERAMNTLKGVGAGAAAGMAFGPVGAAIGAGVGLLGGIAGMWAGNRKARREADRLNDELKAAQATYQNNFANNAQNISQNKFNTAALNLAAFGGMLKDNGINNYTKSRVRIAAFGGDMLSPIGREDGFTNGVVKVDEGGTHESNPNDGVLMGVDPQGIPNLVEEGEVIYNDYVFSNRLAPTKEQLESVKLPIKYADIPFSKIAWKLQEESQINPLDKISQNTLVDNMMKLTTIQEQSRERDNEYTAFDNLEQAFANGGEINIKPSKRGTFTAAAKKRGMGVQEFASTVLANKDKYSPEMVRKANFAHNAAGWKHGFGGPMGNMFAYPTDESSNRITFWDPNAEIPAVALAATMGQTAKQQPTAQQPATVAQPRRRRSTFVNPFTPQSAVIPVSTAPTTGDALEGIFGKDYGNQPIFEAPDLSSYYEPVAPEVVEDEALPANAPKPTTEQENIPEFKTSLANTAMRAIPVIGSSINAMADAFGWRNKEDYSALDLIRQRENQIRNVRTSPIGRYMQFNPYDTTYEMNRLQNVGLGTQRGLVDTAGGNALAARNAMLALNNNMTQQMGAARRSGSEYNDNLRRTVQQFNTGIDQFNAQQALQAGVYNQRSDVEKIEGAIKRAALMDQIQSATSQARSAEETAALNNWGLWGNDRTFADMAQWYQRYVAPYNKATSAYGQTSAAKGGKIKRVKEFKKK